MQKLAIIECTWDKNKFDEKESVKYEEYFECHIVNLQKYSYLA